MASSAAYSTITITTTSPSNSKLRPDTLSTRPGSGRGMSVMPRLPPVSHAVFSATSCSVMPMPMVTMAR